LPLKHANSDDYNQRTTDKIETVRATEEPRYEVLYKKKDEYEAKKKEKMDKMNKDITFIPTTNKNKNEKIGKDVIERN